MIWLFIFFALPVATILLSIVLQNVLKCPILVGITFFSIYLVASFAAFSNYLAEALIATVTYTVIAFITAYLVKTIQALIQKLRMTITNNGQNENVMCNSNFLPYANCSRRASR